MKNKLIENCYYGNEIKGLTDGSNALKKALNYTLSPEGNYDSQFLKLVNITKNFFNTLHQGVFGGPITAGDGIFISTFLDIIKPDHVIEIGVASGISSAFLLNAAQQLEILKPDFLYSFDLVDITPTGNKTGHVVKNQYEQLLKYWSLSTGVTTLDLFDGTIPLPNLRNKKCLVFIDGGHNHPWPFIDILVIATILPRGSWVLLQDVNINERFLQDCIIYGVPSPKPVRGVNLAVSHWPGTKIIGNEISYNMSAIKLDIDYKKLLTYAEIIDLYPLECVFNQNKKLEEIKNKITDMARAE